MDIKAFLGTLVPTFTRQRITDDIWGTRDILKEATLPIFDTYADFIGKEKFKSDYAMALEERFEKNYDGKYSGNMIIAIKKVLDKTEDDLNALDRMVAKYFADDVLKSAMSVMRVNILQYLDCIHYAVNYSRKLLLAVVAAEFSYYKTKSSGQDTPLGLLPGEIDEINNGLANFCACLNVIDLSSNKIEEIIESLPEVTINDKNAGIVMSTISSSETDPLKMGFIPVSFNPIYHIRIKIAEWQVRRYEAAVAEKQMLEFRLQQLKLMRDGGKENAKLDKSIEIEEKRLADLRYKIVRLEEEYGVS